MARLLSDSSQALAYAVFLLGTTPLAWIGMRTILLPNRVFYPVTAVCFSDVRPVGLLGLFLGWAGPGLGLSSTVCCSAWLAPPWSQECCCGGDSTDPHPDALFSGFRFQLCRHEALVGAQGQRHTRAPGASRRPGARRGQSAVFESVSPRRPRTSKILRRRAGSSW